MAYIRWGTKLPSGKKSTAFVIGEDTQLVNLGDMDRVCIPYAEMRKLLKTKDHKEIIGIVKDRLGLTREEAEYVCETIFLEYEKGEWDRPFDFEKTMQKTMKTKKKTKR